MLTLILCVTIVILRKEDFVGFFFIILFLAVVVDAAMIEMIINAIK